MAKTLQNKTINFKYLPEQILLQLIMAVMIITIFITMFGCDEMPEDGSYQLTNPPSQIANGEETNYDSWQGAIGITSDDYGHCTGVLIHPEVVLSAGHCGYSPLTMQPISNPSSLSIVGGADIINSAIFYTTVKEVVIHPNFSMAELSPDVSLMKLAAPIENIEPYGLVATPGPTNGTKGIIVGYGKTASNESGPSGIHRKGDTTFLDVQSMFIETGNPSNGCQGDSGGPLYMEQGGKWLVAGVTAHGSGPECDPNAGTFYTNIFTELEWINKTMNSFGFESFPDTGSDDPDTDDPDTDDPDTDDPDTDGAANDAGDNASDDYFQWESDDGCGCQTAIGYDGNTQTIGLLRSIISLIN